MAKVESLSAQERETTVTTCDADKLVHIWSAQRRHITRMRKDDAFTEVAGGFLGTTGWAEFTIPADRWSPLGVKRTRTMTTEQRQEAAERLAGVRQSAASRATQSS